MLIGLYESYSDEVKPARFRVKTVHNLQFGLHMHRQVELIRLVRGELLATIHGAQYALRPGDACLMMPHVLHAYESPCDNAIELSVFEPELLPSLSRRVFSGHALYAVLPASAQENDMLACFDWIFRGNETDMDLLAGYHHIICRRMLRRMPDGPLQPPGAAMLVHAALQYITCNLLEPLSLPRTAAALNVSPGHLSSLIRRQTGISFPSFVSSLRVQYAKKLLMDSSLQIGDIAYESGFQCLRTFNRVFLENEGMRPAEFRHSYGTGKAAPRRPS